jgi:hypothetical protein
LRQPGVGSVSAGTDEDISPVQPIVIQTLSREAA